MEEKNSINHLELLAAFFGLKNFAKNQQNCQILMHIDNTTAVSYINRIGGIEFPHLNKITKEIWQWCEAQKSRFFATCIEFKENHEAGFEFSRLDLNTEFELNYVAFLKIISFFPAGPTPNAKGIYPGIAIRTQLPSMYLQFPGKFSFFMPFLPSQ